MNLKNKTNEYQQALGHTFDICPKAVLGAVVASLASCGGDLLDESESALQREWWILYHNGIVPQRPPFPDSSGFDARFLNPEPQKNLDQSERHETN